jgi:hypothetical protein
MPPFTRENAAIMSAKGNASRWSRPRQSNPPAEAPEIPAEIPQTIVEVESFTSRRLTRVRDQLERLDRMAAEEDDPKRIKELADATTRLSEQERILDGRPMPGSRRPPTDKAQRAGTWGELQPALPQVAPVAQVAPVQSPAQVQPVKPMGWEYDEPTSIPAPTDSP